jgi:hypothetical protein
MLGFLMMAMYKKKKKKKKKKTPRQKLRIVLDNLWRDLIKEIYGFVSLGYYRCEKCGKIFRSGKGAGKGKSINSHHIIGKSNWNVRWDLRDGSPLCSGDHTLNKDSAHQDRSAFLKKIIEKRGQGWYDKLYKRAGREGGSKKWTLKQMERRKEQFKKILKKLQKKHLPTTS